MSYHTLGYFAVFLPAVLILYQLTPQKLRWITLLAADYVFFFLESKFLILWMIGATAVAYFFGLRLDTMKRGDLDRKVFKKKKTNTMRIGILLLLAALVFLKYTNFLGTTIWSLLGKEFTELNILVPVGVSYYTLQGISYIVDVKNGKYPASHHIGKFALYMSFFPAILEGPIARWNDYGPELGKGMPITADNLAYGYERILWGLMKKLTIADHLAPAVNNIFTKYTNMGGMAIIGAVCCTLQLYMDFSGTIDIVIGTGEIFGLHMPENFRQPFFAKDAGDFWRRWHITLGAFLRDYVFYPVSLAKPIQKLSKWTKAHLGNTAARYIGPIIALAAVWLCNGLWHGASFVYIFYGIYYLFFMTLELLIKNPIEKFYSYHNFNDNSPLLRVIRFFKMAGIVCFGEMFFRVDTFSAGIQMTKSIFTNPAIRQTIRSISSIGLDSYDYVTILLCFIPVVVVSVLNEKGFDIRGAFEKKPLPVRWAILLVTIFAVLFFGAYGPGYDAAGMMYAGF